MIGGASGAGVGAIIGHNSHGRTAGGALIGGAVGALGGALVGNQIDKDNAGRQATADRAAREPDYSGYSYSSSGYPPPPPPSDPYYAPPTTYYYYDAPPARVEVIPAPPYRGAVWVRGYWFRGRHAWVWVPGHWA